jgi:predicted nucleic acid-binding protein
MANPIAVIDANLVIKSLLPNPETDQCQAVLARLQDYQLVAPALWVYEVTSTLTKAVHFGQITEAESREALHQAMTLGIQIVLPDEVQSSLAFDWTLKLKRAAAYDSFYLVIAESLDAEFWTVDQRLLTALGEKKPTWVHWASESSG